MPTNGGRAGGAAKPDDEVIGDPRSIIVWRAEGLAAGELKGTYCVARVGPAGSSWESKPRSGGRRSGTTTWTINVDWKLSFTVDVGNLDKPEVHIRVYDKDWVSSDTYLGEARALLADLPADQVGKKLPLSGANTSEEDFVVVSSGGPTLLEQLGVKPSSFWETLAPIGQVKSVKVDDITGDGPFRLGEAPLPEVMRGLFWLTQQGSGSAVASFGGPSNDGGGCSTGVLDEAKYTIRCSGDRVWGGKTLGWTVDPDLVYHFTFDSADNPTKVEITPEFRKLGVAFVGEWLLDFDGVLEPGTNDPEYPGSIVWHRPSYILGVDVFTYKLVQVINDKGQRLEPAWSKFVAYMNDPANGGTPGEVLYYQID